jgi:hypothetical protein
MAGGCQNPRQGRGGCCTSPLPPARSDERDRRRLSELGRARVLLSYRTTPFRIRANGYSADYSRNGRFVKPAYLRLTTDATRSIHGRQHLPRSPRAGVIADGSILPADGHTKYRAGDGTRRLVFDLDVQRGRALESL